VGNIATDIERKELKYHGVELMTIDTLFGRWWIEYGQKLRGSGTEKFRIQNLIANFTDNLPIKDLNDKEVHSYIQFRQGAGASIPTIKRELTTLRSALKTAATKWGEEVGQVNWRDHKLKDSQERDIYATTEEMANILTLLEQNIKLAALWSLYAMTRLGETKSVRRADFYPNEGFCFVNGKTGKRRVFLSEIAIKAAILAMKLNEDPVYIFDLRNRRRQWERARKLAGREDIRWHDLRHIGASWLNHGSNDPIKSQKALGHTNFKTTMRYIHSQGGGLTDALNAMPKVIDIADLEAEKK
jgi:integrase